MKQDVVIIGGGVAAVNAIKAIREVDKDMEILVIQNESIYPYYRIKLTKSLFDNLDEDSILLQKKEWYESNNVNLYLGKEVTCVDTKNSRIVLEDGSSLEYGTLLLANGANNFKPPIEGIEKENCYTIRTFDDIQCIKNNSCNMKTILNIGGGIQNLEAAWAFCSHGKEVVIVETMDKLMPRQLDRRASEILKDAVEAFHVKVLLNTQIVAITGDNKVNGATTDRGESIPCDMVLYSVGIRPNLKICTDSSIHTNMGIVVDEHMQTNIKNIYAAGDVVELHGRVGGLWPIAMEQGKIAGYNIVGKNTCYNSLLPVTTMNAFQLSIFSIGNIDENCALHSFVEDPCDGKSYKRIFIEDNRIVGAIIIGTNKYNNLLKRFVEQKINISTIDNTNISVTDYLDKLKSM